MIKVHGKQYLEYYTPMTNAALKQLCEQYGLIKSGNKIDLVCRLATYRTERDREEQERELEREERERELRWEREYNSESYSSTSSPV